MLAGPTNAASQPWPSLFLLIGALALGTLGYRDHFLGHLPWWRWTGELFAGCLLLVLALRPEDTPAEAPQRIWARRAVGAVGIAAFVAAVLLFPQHGREIATGIAICVALAGFIAWRWTPFAPVDVQALMGEPHAGEAERPAFTLTRGTLLVASLAAAAAAALVNAAHHLAGFLLWAASLALFAASLWQRQASPPAPAPHWRRSGGPPLSRRAEVIALVLVLVLGFALRGILLRDAPAKIDPDEGRQGRYAERIWENGFPNAFDIGWNVFPHLSYMVEYVWVQARGTSNANLRLSAATVGVLSLIPAFFWVRRWWGNVIALMAVFLLAINFQHISWSRLALNNIQQVLVAGLMLATFARLLRTRRWLDWVWFGYATGLAFHTYHAAKLFPALLAVVAVALVVGIRGFVRRYVAGALVGAVAFVLCIGPLSTTMYKRWDAFYGGTSNRFDLARLVDAYERGDVYQVRHFIRSHVAGCLYSFISIPSQQFATFDPFVAVPFLLGVGWMLWRWRDPRHLVVLVWSIGILVIGGMITDYPPWMARLIGFLPTVCVIPAVVGGRLRQALFRCLPKHADWIAVPLLFVWLGGALFYNWSTVFVVLPARQHGDIMTSICRVVDDTRLPATFYMAGAEGMAEPKVAINDCMIARQPDRVLVNLPDDPSIVPVPPTSRGTVKLLVSRKQRELLPLVRHYYPQARYDIVHDVHGADVLHIFTLHEGQLHRSRGLLATYTTPTRRWVSDVAVSEFTPPPKSDFPVEASFRGQLWIPTPGTYAFRSIGADLRLNRRSIGEDGTVRLDAGWHLIDLEAVFRNAAQGAQLRWKPPHAPEWMPVPRGHLHQHPERHGLLGRYFGRLIRSPGGDAAGRRIAEKPDYTRIETAPSFDYHYELDERPPEPFAARPSTMEWTGTVEVPEGDTQTIRLETTTPAQVFLDGTLVLSIEQGGREGVHKEAVLPNLTGRVPILIRTARPADDEWRFWKLRLLWRAAGGEWNAFVRYHPPETDNEPRTSDARPTSPLD
jgi:4-amino-4-deoxy-L-arabinose transferase-like glycosyltransferase